MADELDKFVLQYTVEMKDAIARLEQLNGNIEKTNKHAKSAGNELKEFASGSADEIGKMVPGVDGVTSAIKALGAEAALAGIAIGAIAIGIKSVMDMREQYNAQRKEGMDIGISTLRLEEYQRKFVKASGGNITRNDTAAELKKLSEFSSAVYRDPTRIGTEARTARVLGIDMKQPGQQVGVNELMEQLGKKFEKMTDAQVMAFAKIMNMNQDFALGLKKQGAGVGNITELTESDIVQRQSAQKSLEAYNAAMAQLEEQFNQMKMTLGQSLIPALAEFVKLLNDAFGWLHKFNAETNANLERMSKKQEENNAKVADAKAKADKGDMTAMNKLAAESKQKAYEQTGWYQLKTWWQERNKKPEAAPATTPTTAATTNASPKDDAAKAAKAAADTAKANEKTSADLKKLVDGDADKNAEAKAIADKNALAINQFAGAVASFANAVDERQAWAAWAGEIGKAAGLGSTNTATAPGAAPSVPAPVGKTQYDDIFNEAAEKYGVDAAMLKRIAKVESGFNANAVSKVGASGVMQIMPSNFKSLGITNAFDPRQNIMGGANIYAQMLKRAKGDTELALRYYNGGFDRSRWGKENEAYAGKVMGAQVGTPSVKGESRSNIQLKSVQNTIAQRLGVPVQQLQLGGINRGDVSFASSQIESGIQNQIYDLKNQMKAVNLPQQTMSKLMNELRAQESGLAMMRQYSAQVVGQAQPGERSITIGERAIVINVNGAADPEATAAHIQAHLNEHINEIVNGTATVVKR